MYVGEGMRWHESGRVSVYVYVCGGQRGTSMLSAGFVCLFFTLRQGLSPGLGTHQLGEAGQSASSRDPPSTSHHHWGDKRTPLCPALGFSFLHGKYFTVLFLMGADDHHPEKKAIQLRTKKA